METDIMTASPFKHHLLLVIRQEKSIRGFQIIDFVKDLPPLTRELGYRIQALQDESSGLPWNLDVRLESMNDDDPSISVDAYLLAQGHDPEHVLSQCLPVDHLTGIAASLAKQLKIQSPYQLELAVLEQDNPVVKHWYATRSEAKDFEIIPSSAPGLQVPKGLATLPPRPGRSRGGSKRATWLRCAFTKSTFQEFTQMAESESRHERSWVGMGQAFHDTAARHCYVTIENLMELSGESAQSWMQTRGRDFCRVWKKHGQNLTAFLHLHPRLIDGKQVTATPSLNDNVVAWDFSLSTEVPCVFPIALYGSPIRDLNRDIDVFGYNNGILSPIQWEIFE